MHVHVHTITCDYLNLQFRDYSDDESEHNAKTKSRDRYNALVLIQYIKHKG